VHLSLDDQTQSFCQEIIHQTHTFLDICVYRHEDGKLL
jgi:hypothetical protein